MKKIIGLVMLMTSFGVSARADQPEPFTGFSFSIGKHQSEGDFTLSHRGSNVSLGTLLEVPLVGDMTTYSARYGWQLGDSNWRLAVSGAVHEGTIGGAMGWEGDNSAVSFAVASDLQLSAGVEVGAVLGNRERMYVSLGAGVVATDLTAGLTIDTPDGDWSDQKSGGSLGTIYWIGGEYEVAEHFSLELKLSRMAFNAAKALDLSGIGQHNLTAELEQTTIGLNVIYRF